LALGFESRQDGSGAITFGLDQLYCDPALYRFQLVGHPHAAHAAFADALQKLVSPGDDYASRLGRTCIGCIGPGVLTRGGYRVRLIEELTRKLVGLEQLVHVPAQLGLIRAGVIQKGGKLGRVFDLEGLQEKLTFVHG